MRRLGSEAGMVLTEMLMASALFIVILGATLTAFTTFEQTSQANQRQNDSQDQVRNSMDVIAKQLRNLASPTASQPDSVELAQPYDLVFQSVDPVGPNSGANDANVRRLRYCLSTTNPANELLWMQWQTWTTATPPSRPTDTACPGSGWPAGQSRVAANYLTNRNGGQDRPVFSYNSTTVTDITSIGVKLFTDVNPAASPPETRLSTGVFLRNQNKKPVANFTPSVSGRRIILNGSTSFDPEGDNLTYDWYDRGVKVGSGVVFLYDVPTSKTGTPSITLKVYDSAPLESDFGPVSIPGIS